MFEVAALINFFYSISILFWSTVSQCFFSNDLVPGSPTSQSLLMSASDTRFFRSSMSLLVSPFSDFSLWKTSSFLSMMLLLLLDLLALALTLYLASSFEAPFLPLPSVAAPE